MPQFTEPPNHPVAGVLDWTEADQSVRRTSFIRRQKLDSA